MTTTYIKADKFFYPYESKMGGYLELTADGKFGNHVDHVADGSTVLDYSGKFIAPGLVDTHVHGYAGVDVMDNHKDGIVHTMSDALLDRKSTRLNSSHHSISYA